MSDLERRVLYRYLIRVAMTEDKFKLLLLKIRKGATSSITLKQWIEALSQLGGWKIEPFVGLVQMHGYGKEDKPAQEVATNLAAVQQQHAWLKQFEVLHLPTNPQVGKRYVTDVTEPTSEGWAPGLFGFEFKDWLGAKGIRFTSPEGKIYEHMRGRFDQQEDPLKLPTHKFTPWLFKETKLTEQVSNYLGLETHEAEREKAKLKTRSGSGTCPCCFRNIKIKERGEQPPVIVLHGYRRPGWGQVQGRCYGVNFPPFELSTTGTEHLLKVLSDRLAHQKEFLAKLQSGRITELFESYSSHDKALKKITPENPKWTHVLKKRVDLVKNEVVGLKKDIELLSDLVSKWKVQSLPQEGDKIKPPPDLLR